MTFSSDLEGFNNFLHHVQNLSLFFKNLKLLLKSDGYIVSSVPDVSNSLKTRLLELSLELRDVDPYFTRMSRSVTNKLKRAEQLIRIVYVNGVSYFEQQFGIPYVPPLIPNIPN